MTNSDKLATAIDLIERQGLRAMDDGDFESAAKLLLEATALYEELGDPLRTNAAGFYLGAALAEQGKVSQAIRVWEEIIERGWDSPAAFNRLVRYYEQRGQPEKVKQLFERLSRAAHEMTGEFFVSYESSEAVGRTGQPRVGSGPAGRHRVLVADDEPSICDLVERAIEPLHCDVLKAGDGYEGLRMLLSTQVGLAILDVFMPGYSGLDILYRIRAEAIEIPVILISGRHDDQTLEDAAKLGATFVAKPFSLQEILDTVKSTIE